MPPSVSIFALTTCGLETVSAAEMASLAGVTVTHTAYRRLVATCHASLATLLALRTVDDVFLDVATWTDIGRSRDALARLRAFGARLDLRGPFAACAGVRSIGTPPAFAVTANFIGRRNYSASEIKAAVAAGIAHAHGWIYRDDDRRADLNVRLFIEHETAYVGVRLARSPLHERPYACIHRPGALKPSVAAALVALAGVERGMGVLDPCCGTGTIVIEAAQRGAMAQGGDVDPAAVEAARANAHRAGVAATFRELDARRLPFADGSLDRVIANPPWGCQVSACPDPARFYRRATTEMARALAPGGRLALLTTTPHLVPLADLRCVRRLDVSLFGQRPTILVCVPHSG